MNYLYQGDKVVFIRYFYRSARPGDGGSSQDGVYQHLADHKMKYVKYETVIMINNERLSFLNNYVNMHCMLLYI